MLIENYLTLTGRLNEVTSKLIALLSLDTKSLKLLSKLVDGDLRCRVVAIFVKQKRRHPLRHQLLLL